MERSREKREERKRSFYDPERPVWRGLGKLTDLFYVSMLWLVCCLPVITFGASTAAAYSVTVHCIRKGEPGLLARFLEVFKREFKQATLCSLLWTAAAVFWAFLVLFALSLADEMMSFVFMLDAALVGVVVLGSIAWVFPALSRFQMGFWALNRAAVKLVFAHLPATLAMIAASLAAVFACAVWLFPVIILPGAVLLFHSLWIEQTFSRS